MSELAAVFVNDHPVRVPAGAVAADAVAARDPAMAARLLSGTAYLTDARGIRLESSAPLFSGAILRVVLSARAPQNGTDAHA